MLLKIIGSMVMFVLAFSALSNGAALFALLFLCLIPLIITYG